MFGSAIYDVISIFIVISFYFLVWLSLPRIIFEPNHHLRSTNAPCSFPSFLARFSWTGTMTYSYTFFSPSSLPRSFLILTPYVVIFMAASNSTKINNEFSANAPRSFRLAFVSNLRAERAKHRYNCFTRRTANGGTQHRETKQNIFIRRDSEQMFDPAERNGEFIGTKLINYVTLIRLMFINQIYTLASVRGERVSATRSRIAAQFYANFGLLWA